MNNRQRLKVTRQMARQSLKMRGVKRPGLMLELMLRSGARRQDVTMSCFLTRFDVKRQIADWD